MMRIVVPLQMWPFPLAILANPRASEHLKANVRRAFLHAGPCCGDDVVRKLRPSIDTEAALAAQQTFLEDVFHMTPGQNIRSETRFGRMKNHWRSAGQNYPDAASLFAEHVLSESWCMMAVAAKR